jgi:hypothetical protein
VVGHPGAIMGGFALGPGLSWLATGDCSSSRSRAPRRVTGVACAPLAHLVVQREGPCHPKRALRTGTGHYSPQQPNLLSGSPRGARLGQAASGLGAPATRAGTTLPSQVSLPLPPHLRARSGVRRGSSPRLERGALGSHPPDFVGVGGPSPGPPLPQSKLVASQ